MGRKRDESKKFHIDDSTIKGIIIIAVITKVIDVIVEAVKKMAVPLAEFLFRLALRLWFKLIALLNRLGELLYRKWYWLAAVGLAVALGTMLWNVLIWVQERKSLERKLAWLARRLKRAAGWKEKEEFRRKYFDRNEAYKSWVREWKRSLRKRVSVASIPLVLFCGMGAYQNSPQMQTIMHSMDAEIAANGGIDKIIEEITRGLEDMSRAVNMDIGFVLEEPDRLQEPSPEQRQMIFYIGLNDGRDDAEEVRIHLQIIRGADREDNAVRRTPIEEGVIDEASKLETDFLKGIAAAQGCAESGELEDWSKTIPVSGTLDKIIGKREGFWADDPQSDKGDGELCFLLANDCQRYAKEYARQGGKPQTVVYYYAMSALWTERAMSYSNITAENEKMYYNYLRARYKDISDYLLNHISRIPEDERQTYCEMQLKSEIIHNAM